MKRLWLVDDAIPVELVYGGAPTPYRFSRDVVAALLQQHTDGWPEPEVRALCAALVAEDLELTFFRAPEAAMRGMRQDLLPPHAVILDWEGPGFSVEGNLAAIELFTQHAITFVQVYSKIGLQKIESALTDIRTTRGDRILAARSKEDVAPPELTGQVVTAMSGTIAEHADKLRETVRSAVERTLVDMASVPQGALTDIANNRPEELLSLLLARVRDDVGTNAGDILTEIAKAQVDKEPGDAQRRLLSVWYYFFPMDDRVRRGDLIEFADSDELGLVVTPVCDLVSFKKKTGSCLTWLRAIPLSNETLGALKTAGMRLENVGGSIIAAHARVGNAVMIVPSVPAAAKDRNELRDYVVLAHQWNSTPIANADGGVLVYGSVPGIERRCTIAAPLASALITHAAGVITSPGAPDLPAGERTRLNELLKK